MSIVTPTAVEQQSPVPPAPIQPAPVQPVPVQPAMYQPAPAPTHEGPLEVRIYSHTNLFYWWPVWVFGYVMALITYLGHETVNVGGRDIMMYHNKDLGVIYTMTIFLVVLTTNVSVRGAASAVVILAFAFVVLLLAYMGVWGEVLGLMGMVAIYMNLSFYLTLSTLIFLVWAFSVFVYDRLEYWKVVPGQMTHERVIGGAQRSYDTRGMMFEKYREDLFRQYILGFGSGDLQITTTGAKSESFSVPNVLFINTKLGQVQHLIAMKPTEQAAVAP